MKRITGTSKILIWVVCLLIIIMASGLWSIYYLDTTSKNLESSINSSSSSVQAKHWDKAYMQLEAFEEAWLKTKNVWAIFTDHCEIDVIDTCYTKSKYYIVSKNYASALTELETLKQYILDIPKKEKFSYVNIL